MWEPLQEKFNADDGRVCSPERLTRAQIKAWFGSWERETTQEEGAAAALGSAARRPGRGQQRQAEAQADAEAGAAKGSDGAARRGYWWHKATRCGEQQEEDRAIGGRRTEEDPRVVVARTPLLR